MPKPRGFSLWFVLTAVVCLGVLGGLMAESPSASSSAVMEIISVAREDNRAMDHLDHLVNDIGPRPVDSVASLEAYKWARNQFVKFGLADAHLERCGETEGNFSDRRTADRFRRLHRSLFKEKPEGDKIPICNVVADIPGSDLANEYVILGAHIDTVPTAPGATDNGTGVAAVMEAARILAEAGVKPRRTIRFILFGGEEVGLIGSRGYLEAHPELASRISAVYNMDHGAGYIRGVQATAPMMSDMREAFGAVTALASDMSFKIEQVKYLPSADPNCCASMSKKLEDGTGRRVETPWSGGGGGACGGAGACQGSGGKEIRVESSGAGDAAGATGVTMMTVTGDGDTLVRYVEVPGGAEGCGSLDLGGIDLEALGISADDLKSGGGEIRKRVAIGSSDHAAFLAAGIPAFWWTQDVTDEVPYYAHSSEDTYDKVPSQFLQHSAEVIALGAFGTANLDGMLSREVLADPNGLSIAGGKSAGVRGTGSTDQGKAGSVGSSSGSGAGCGASCGGAKTKSGSTRL